MFIMSLVSFVIIFGYNYIFESFNKDYALTDAFLKVFKIFITGEDHTLNMANQYLFSVILIFLPSFLIFYLIMKQFKKSKIFNDLYIFNIKRCLAYYTIILVFFGFLQLFFSPISIDELIMGEINNIFIAISLGSLFPYFYLLLDEGRDIYIRPAANELIGVMDKREMALKKKRYDNIYFLLSILFLLFIFVLIYYMYQQKFEWNSDNISIFITGLGALATFAAASAAAWAAWTAKNSLLEQSAANERAVKPYLILQDKSYQVDISSRQHPFMFNWDSGEKLKRSIKKEFNSYLQIHNISDGIAKKVVVKTSVKNYLPFLEKINSLETTSNGMKLTSKTLEDGALMLNINGEVKTRDYKFNEYDNMFYLGESTQRFTALGIKKEEKTLIKVPQAFMILINFYISKEFRINESISLPYLEVDISCESIQEKEYNFKYCIQIASYHINENIFNEDRNIQFDIKVSEK